MKNFFKNIILFALFCSVLGGWGAHAQLFPVQLTPVFNSPYSVKLSDYATSMDTKMRLLINPTDISISQRQVRLKLHIQGNGLNIQTSDYMVGQRPIFINGGELQTLTNTDIGALFRLENLQGITALQYANGLPEGMYSFCFEMFDYMTNQRISQKSCASLYLILNDPPLLNTPQKNEQIASSDFPNIMFTWTPRQMNATNISYKFELKRLIDPTLDPQFAFQMSPLLYEETLFGTALLYNLSMPILTPGMRYAWKVKAISTTGLSENAVFKNDGYSEIYSFKYTASCPAPTFLLSESQSSKSVKITWEGIPEHTRYQVQYKKQNVRNAQWFSTNSLNTQSLITNLEPGLTYEFRVGSSCDPATDGVQSFTYSGISTFTTPTETSAVPAYNCGIIPQINIQNQKPLTNLIQSETFKAGDFPVTILELKGENSPYSGRGYIIVPYLKDAKIAVEFNNIVVNTDYQLISGIVETSYNPEWKNVTDVEDFTGEGQGGQIEETVPFEIKDIVINPNGDIVVNGNDGQQVTIPGGKDTVITDSKGNTYTVDKNGNGSNQPTEPAEGGKPTPENTDGVDKNGQATAFTAKGISIAFSGNGSKYAFDVMPNNAATALQKLYKKVGDVALPYKAVLNGDTDTVLATINITDANVKADSIVFKTQNGAKINVTRNDKVFVLTVKGNLSYAEEEILATIKQGKKWKVIGAFMLVHISPKEVNVALVPTDNISKNRLDEVIANTQAIYNKVGVKINFKKEDVLEDFDRVVPGKTIQTEKNSLTSTYSTEQQNINALYHGTDNSYVLFITNKPSSTGQDGYMRLNGQFGYVFPSRTEAVGLKTPAHELGHGIFKLQHPFEQYKTSESGTDFLMDYSSGTILNHLDWKQINDPAFKLYAFQSQASGQFALAQLTPNWEPFTYEDSNTYVTFNRNTPSLNGTVQGISVNDVVYKWNSTQNNYFREGSLEPLKIKVIDKPKPDLVVQLFWMRDKCGYDERYSSKWSYLSDKKGFNIDDVKEKGFVTFNDRIPCQVEGVNQGSDSVDTNCDGKDIALLNKQKEDVVALIKTVDINVLTKKINEIDICAIRKLTYEQIESLVTKISSLKDIDDEHEKALLRLMNSVKEEKYRSLYDLLENGNNKLIKHYINEFNDHSINPFDGNNYTSLNMMLLKMYQSNPKAWIDRIPVSDLPEYFVDKYFTKPTVKILSLNDLISGTSEIYEQGFQYNPDNGKIRITHTATAIQAVIGNATGAYYAPVGMPRIISTIEVDPLTPVMIDFNDDLQVIEIALNNAGYQKGQEIVIPALFLKFGLDKLKSNTIEKSSLLALNGLTIVTGAPAIIQGATLAKRLWALAEVAGAAGDIAVNTEYVQKNHPKLTTATNIFNGTMGVVGLKNLITNTGIRSFVKNLPPQVKQAFKDSKEIKSILAAKYINWRIAVSEIKDISTAEQQLISKQEKIWKAFGMTEKMIEAESSINKMLKNADFKNIYDDLLSGATARRFAKELSLEEEAIYKFYTNVSYYKFNQSLIEGSKTEDIIEIEKLLNRSLDKVKSSPSTYYRGIGKVEMDKLDNFKEGDKISYENFLSSTDDQLIAVKFIENNIRKTGEGALVIIESKNAKNIKMFSDASKENEFLHKSNSKFILKEVLRNKVINSLEVAIDGATPQYGTIYKIQEL
ncbi:fibronectin type III domain-containing protein [Flavobacterium sp. EDS]|uniref:fibronectin type III domain-containing protein n=1 Tax=Flavobacterium sp. EDS TaxID=2897328 RepID=UPI001E580033|nr:fibronectin type III domain-containing protein [Flavobacterium sp. EDS]MCD0474777.1 fibronectin type III domain-containing protein [Flavobacterium sp. EDS]